MGNKFGCGRSLSSEQREYLSDKVFNVDTTLSNFAKSLDIMIVMLRRLLDRHLPGQQDRNEVTNVGPPLHHQCLEKLIREEKIALTNVCELLHDIIRDLEKNDSSVDINKKRLTIDQHLVETETKGEVLHAFENSEFGHLHTYIIDLQKEKKRLHEQNESLTKQVKSSEKQIRRLSGEIALPTGSIKEKSKTIKEEESKRYSNQQTQTENTLRAYIRTLDSTNSTKETEEKKDKAIQVELDSNTTEHREEERYSSPAIECSKQLEAPNYQKEDGLVEEHVDVKKRIIGKDTEISEFKEVKEHRSAHIQPEGNESFKRLEKEKEVLKTETEQMQKKMDIQSSEFLMQKEKLEQRLESLRTEKENAILNLRHEHEILLKEREKMQKDLIGQKETLSKIKDSLEIKLANEIDEKFKLKSQIEDMTRCINEYELGQSSQKETRDDKNKFTENLGNSVQKLIDENESLKESNRTMMASQTFERETLKTQITELTEERDKLDARVNLLIEQQCILQDTLETQDKRNSTMLNELKEELDKQHEKQFQTELSLTSTKQDNQTLQSEYDTIKQEIDKLKSTKVMRVQLYHHSRIPLVSEIENELKALLKSEMEDAMTELDFVDCNDTRDVDLNIPLLIVCISVSRIGTDAANAIQSLKLTSRMALIIFHHKDEHALPNQASERVLTGQVFTRLGGVYDLAFLSSKGIYTCEMNLKNIKSLVYFLNREGVRSVREGP